MMDKDELSKIFSTYISEYAAAHFGEVQTKQNSFMYRIKLILENVLRLVKHTIDELTQSEFLLPIANLKSARMFRPTRLYFPTATKSQSAEVLTEWILCRKRHNLLACD